MMTRAAYVDVKLEQTTCVDPKLVVNRPIEGMTPHLGIENSLLDLLQLLPGFLDRPDKAIHLFFHLGQINPSLGQTNLRSVDEKGPSRDHPRGGSDPSQELVG